MHHRLTRREFLAASAAAGATAWAARTASALPYKTTLHKALIESPTVESLTACQEAGFAGIESQRWRATPQEAAAARRDAEKLGMRIHSVLRGWTNFNSADRGKVAEDIASVETALRTTAANGGDALLLVPCRVGVETIPEPWEFDIEFDEKTGCVERVVKGDNSPYAEYIEAQNHATVASRKAVQKLIPVAEKTGVVIALENVWNNLWVQPALFANFIASFNSPWVQCYFDIGNHVKYAPPEQWIQALGGLICKIHVKDFLLEPNGRGGKFVDVRDGSVNWPQVRKELDQIGYNGWMTIEGSGKLSREERGKRLDLIIGGK